jgi:hypothetical protein
MKLRGSMTKVSGLGWLAAVLLTALPVYAHEVEVSGEVGATLHIEPNDQAKAGEPTQVWFALTAKGGRVIPLSECNCKLEVHREPHKEGSPPLLSPTLKGIVAEQYQGIPSAELTFPKVGEYELELSGSPKTSAKFSPFRLSYKVVVAGKTEPSKEPDKKTEAKEESKSDAKTSSTETAKLEAETETQSPNNNIWWMVPSGIVLSVGAVGAAIWLIRSNSD